MRATSGGWDGKPPLLKGSYVISENPGRGGRDYYFALFYEDEQVNDQFYDNENKMWRDGIRLGHHLGSNEGSHGCVMISNTWNGECQLKKWQKLQKWIRSTLRRVVEYKNNENPNARNNKVYPVSRYPDVSFKVID